MDSKVFWPKVLLVVFLPVKLEIKQDVGWVGIDGAGVIIGYSA